MGTLTSPKFRIIGHKLSFLLGGGCDVGKIRVELLVNGQIVRKAFADECREKMRRREWDVRQLKNRITEIRLVDASGAQNICSEDDLRSRIFGTLVVQFLACMPLLGFSNSQKMV